ncbi:hypothetical protein DL96DRAFT_1811797 [Flagelloscypha sp. PMI_526]|nr:hypothetical protein DL96DRAFT_1811797 [Flagelloscypha sp. PMI_526]
MPLPLTHVNADMTTQSVRLGLVGHLPVAPLPTSCCYAASPTERQRIETAMEYADKQQRILKANIAILEEASAVQRELLRTNRLFLATQNNLLSPIHSLPLEILTEIFLVYVSMWCLQFDLTVSFMMGGPGCISQVCRRWRYISLNSPGLWTSVPFISCGTEQNPILPCTRWSPSAVTWIARSKDRPLDVFLTENITRALPNTNRSAIIGNDASYKSRDALLATSKLWRTLVVHNVNGRKLRGHLPAFSSPKLQEFAILFESPPLTEGYVDPWLDILRTAVSLRVLRIAGYVHFSTFLPSISTRSLVAIYLHDLNISWGKLCNFVHLEPQLQILKIVRICFSDVLSNLRHPLYHEQVHSFEISWPEELQRFQLNLIPFDQINLPGLVNLRLPSPTDMIAPNIQKLLSHSPKLRRVTFTPHHHALGLPFSLVFPYPIEYLHLSLNFWDIPPDKHIGETVRYYFDTWSGFFQQEALTEKLRSFVVLTECSSSLCDNLYGLELLCVAVQSWLDVRKPYVERSKDGHIVLNMRTDSDWFSTMSLPNSDPCFTTLSQLSKLRRTWSKRDPGATVTSCTLHFP